MACSLSVDVLAFESRNQRALWPDLISLQPSVYRCLFAKLRPCGRRAWVQIRCLRRDAKDPIRHDRVGGLQAQGRHTRAGTTSEKPHPLSTDEYLLREMEAREDAEGGADEWNANTFGDGGWSGTRFFEEICEASQLLGDAKCRGKIAATNR